MYIYIYIYIYKIHLTSVVEHSLCCSSLMYTYLYTFLYHFKLLLLPKAEAIARKCSTK